MTPEQLREVARQFAATVFADGVTATLDLDQITEAVTAWAALISANEAAFREALPAEFRAVTTREQRFQLLSLFLRALYEQGV